MDIIKEINEKTVSISEFNKGQAGRIFEDVKANGPKVVLKNNQAEAVVLSPSQYSSLLEELEDALDLALAVQRLEKMDENKIISQEEFEEVHNIKFSEIEALDENEFV